MHLADQPTRREQRIAAGLHRRRAGVRVLAEDDDVEPALAERTHDDADRPALLLQHRTLLDVGLEIRAEPMR